MNNPFEYRYIDPIEEPEGTFSTNYGGFRRQHVTFEMLRDPLFFERFDFSDIEGKKIVLGLRMFQFEKMLNDQMAYLESKYGTTPRHVLPKEWMEAQQNKFNETAGVV